MAKSKFFLDDEDDKKIIESEPSIKESPKDKKYCKKCGAENAKFAKFCGNCANNEFFETYEEYDEYANYKYCCKCEKKLKSNIKFCPYCGSGEFKHTLEEVRLAKENKVHDEWKAKVKASEDKLNLARKELADLHEEKRKLHNMISDKECEVESEKKRIEYTIEKAKQENKDKVMNFHNEMQSLQNQITGYKTDLIRLEKIIMKSRNETSSIEQEAIDLEYSLANLENEVGNAIYKLYNVQRKAMLDYLNRYYPPKKRSTKTYMDNIDDYLDATFDVSRSEGRVVIDRLKVAARNVVIPERVSRITTTAFKSSSAGYVNFLLIPANIKVIESSLFAKCNSLAAIVIENGVERIEDYAFHYARADYVYFPDSVKYIGKQVFYWNMGAVSIPRGCKYLADSFPEGTIIIVRK